MLIEAAVKELEDALQAYTDSKHISNGAPFPTVHKLDSHLITDMGDHSLYYPTPVAYEKGVLKGDDLIFSCISSAWNVELPEAPLYIWSMFELLTPVSI
jgi:hypothetical protein